jgi:anti-anti-sigma factor
VIRLRGGNDEAVADTTSSNGEPEVTQVLAGDTARVTVTGELTEGARRPLMRVLTLLLLENQALARVLLDVRGISFMNSAGMAVLVQAQRMAAPRGIELALLDPPEGVRRPLQLSGLWRRFPVLDSTADGGVAPAADDPAS